SIEIANAKTKTYALRSKTVRQSKTGGNRVRQRLSGSGQAARTTSEAQRRQASGDWKRRTTSPERWRQANHDGKSRSAMADGEGASKWACG
ncbi:hypothetical protein U1Q18_023781, partial [Sarracenia purpurea var. burkii]